MQKVLVTGAAGFIGYHLSEKLVADGHSVIGVDNLNDYYDVSLKRSRLERLLKHDEAFEFHKLDLADSDAVQVLFGRLDLISSSA